MSTFSASVALLDDQPNHPRQRSSRRKTAFRYAEASTLYNTLQTYLSTPKVRVIHSGSLPVFGSFRLVISHADRYKCLGKKQRKCIVNAHAPTEQMYPSHSVTVQAGILTTGQATLRNKTLSLLALLLRSFNSFALIKDQVGQSAIFLTTDGERKHTYRD